MADPGPQPGRSHSCRLGTAASVRDAARVQRIESPTGLMAF